MPAIQKIANFTIKGHLGKGGMGDVYKAIQHPLGRTVALKLLMNQGTGNDEAVARFETEARAIARLDHNNIVSLYEYGEENNINFFAMQYVDGTSLDQVLKKKKQLPLFIVMDFAKQICRGLLYAHKKGIIHRDIKPHNILITKNGDCLVSDFGIAQIFRESRITMTGIAVGTPEYMSPEQARGEKLDNQTDIYSLGTLLYEMLTGNPPFTGKNPVSVAYNQVHSHPIPPSSIRKDIPKRLELIILKALKKDKADRYKSIEGMLNDLDTVQLEEKSTLFESKPKPNKETTKVDDKRITDRRSGDRRTGSRRGGTGSIPEVKFNLFCMYFWKHTLKQQWLSLILVAILYVYLIIK